MKRLWQGLAVLALGIVAGAAPGDTTPEVVMATPGTVGGGAVQRFTARFSEAMVPLGDPRAAAPFGIACPVGGAGRWADQQTFVWEFAAALPGGTTCTFTLNEGLRSLRRAAVGGQRRFVVDTGGPAARAVLAGRQGDRIEEDAVFLVATNVPADRASIAANGYCAVDGIGEKIPLDVLPAATPATVLGGMTERYEASAFLEEAGLPVTLPPTPAALASVVAVKCRRPLPPGRDMALVWSGAIRAAGSARTAGADRRFDYAVRPAFDARFECTRTNAQAGCSPVADAYLQFAGPVPIAQARRIRLEVAGRSIAPTLDKDATAAVEEVKFARPFAEAADGRIVLPPDLTDESGRPLANARRFPLPVRFDAAPPLVKFAAPFGILEAKEGGVLPLTVRNVEPELRGRMLGVGGAVKQVIGSDALVARWLTRVTAAGDSRYRSVTRDGRTVSVNETGAASILAGAGDAKPLTVALPGQGKAFEVVGVPLGRPGFYVVELASPRLGAALLGRKAPRYVAAGALVTNMAVHFKWGRATSLAWVTALDTGKPVAGAEVRVADGCTGAMLAGGTSDVHGRLTVAGGLPEPATYGSCTAQGDTHPLMISARRDGDFSFTMTTWGEGIRPYDFELPYGWSEQGEILHTVFDRALIRQGETVNMKQILRRPVARGFAAGALAATLRLRHAGSDTEYEQPVAIGADGIGVSQWTAPKGAPLGDYALSFVVGDRTIYTEQTIRVDEYRMPTMRASVAGPKAAQVRPKAVPL
ncbi:MAG: MG2 domain-containing protein, partial [Sphingomonas sp.]